MHTASLVVTVITVIVTGGIAVADLIPAKFVLANSAEVGCRGRGYRRWG